MDEKMQTILENVQKTAAVIGETAADAAYGVGIRARELLTVGKMNARLADLKLTVQTELRQVGELIYATHMHIPAIGISYDPKVDAFLAYAGQPSAILPDHPFGTELAARAIEAASAENAAALAARDAELCALAQKNAALAVELCR